MSVTIKTCEVCHERNQTVYMQTHVTDLKVFYCFIHSCLVTKCESNATAQKQTNKDICSSRFYHHHSLEAALLRFSNEILMKKDENFWFNSTIQILTLIIAENFGFSSVILSCGVSQGSVLGPAVFALYLLAFGETLGTFKGVSCLTYDMIASYKFYFFHRMLQK